MTLQLCYQVFAWQVGFSVSHVEHRDGHHEDEVAEAHHHDGPRHLHVTKVHPTPVLIPAIFVH